MANKGRSYVLTPMLMMDAIRRTMPEDSEQQGKTSRRAILLRLSRDLGAMMAEQKKLADRMKEVAGLLKLLSEDPDQDMEDDFDLDENVNLKTSAKDAKRGTSQHDDENEGVEYGGTTYHIGDKVVLMDSRTKTWMAEPWRLTRFRDVMVFMKRGGQETRRKYGNFRHYDSKAEDDSD